MSQSIQAQIDHYLQQDLDALSLSEIRAELREKQFSEEDIREIVAEIDKHKLLGISQTTKANFEISQRTIGFILVFLGVAVTGASFVFMLKGAVVWVVAYGPIITGIFLILKPVRFRGGFEQSRIRGRKKR
jgi:hypothetical protein